MVGKFTQNQLLKI